MKIRRCVDLSTRGGGKSRRQGPKPPVNAEQQYRALLVGIPYPYLFLPKRDYVIRRKSCTSVCGTCWGHIAPRQDLGPAPCGESWCAVCHPVPQICLYS